MLDKSEEDVECRYAAEPTVGIDTIQLYPGYCNFPLTTPDQMQSSTPQVLAGSYSYGGLIERRNDGVSHRL